MVNVKVFTLSNFIRFSRLFILIGFVSSSDANYTLALTEAAVFPPRVCVCAECPLWIDLQSVEMFQGLRSGTSPSKSMLIKMAIFFPVKFNFEVENALRKLGWNVLRGVSAQGALQSKSTSAWMQKFKNKARNQSSCHIFVA